MPGNPVDDLAFWWKHDQKRKFMELQEILGVSKETFWNWRKQRRIPLRHIAKIEALGFKLDARSKKPIDFSYSTRFDDSVTLESIASEFGISRERARQLIISAMVSFEVELEKRGITVDDLFGPE